MKCILRQIFNEIEEYQVYIGTKTTYEILLKQKFLCFDFNFFVCFISISVQCLFRQIFNEIVEYQDFYRNEDDF